VQKAEASVCGEGLETIGKNLIVRQSDPRDSLVLHICNTAVKPYSCSSRNTDVHLVVGLEFRGAGEVNLGLGVASGEDGLAVGRKKNSKNK
jgi:hypothetical protein